LSLANAMIKPLLSLVAFFLTAFAPSAPAADPPAPRYTYTTPSADGIGKIHRGREIAKVMTYHGADWLEREERTREEQPDRVLDALELKPGMSVADVGAGTGYYSRRIAQRVGRTGTVYAVDVQPEMLKRLEQGLARDGVSNVKPVLATPADPRLPAQSIDLALMVDVYHELEYPVEVVSAIVAALKPGGRLVLVEFRGDDPGVPIKPAHTMTERQVRSEMAPHRLEWVSTLGTLPWQHVLVFRKRP
jgi:SAM-dependent methyltransferase